MTVLVGSTKPAEYPMSEARLNGATNKGPKTSVAKNPDVTDAHREIDRSGGKDSPWESSRMNHP